MDTILREPLFLKYMFLLLVLGWPPTMIFFGWCFRVMRGLQWAASPFLAIFALGLNTLIPFVMAVGLTVALERGSSSGFFLIFFLFGALSWWEGLTRTLTAPSPQAVQPETSTTASAPKPAPEATSEGG